ncbi:uncharacterized protein LOC111058672 isoform X2 [Nilaparvata lugens]|uniref:uncharacterized protein LOC111058672 isoform X2 n=1 Tax=Nilaparvata lugens TaxID=108931 RepID=UPI00193DDD9F|nr:uncharacterized protein LOC111058672 isoform X2 [Nilaparvata lugens]
MSISPSMDHAPLSTWIENWIMDVCGTFIEESIQNNDLSKSTSIQYGSLDSESHSFETIGSQSSNRTCNDESDKQNTCPVFEDVSSSVSSRDSTTLGRDRKLHLDMSSITFEELCNRFHSTSELDLLTEIKRRVTQHVRGRSKKMKPAKLRSVGLCTCYEKDFGLDNICSLCQRNAKEDLTYSGFDKLELEQEIHKLLYFPLDDERVHFLDDEKKCFQNCHNYISSHSEGNMEMQNVRMVYRIALSAFTCLTRLSINYNYVADGSGETLFCIGAIRKGKLADLEILCTNHDTPSNSKQPHTYLTKRLSIPNLVWKKLKCLCPQLRLHLVMLSLTLELWNFAYKTDDTLVKLLMKLKHVERFRYRGPIQSMQTIDRICDYYLGKENLIELKIWKIQEPLFRPEADLDAIKCKEKQYKPEFVNREVDFALGSFPL